MAPTYWLDLFTAETWEEFLDNGGEVSGFSPRRFKTVQRMKPGDLLLCYMTRVSRWVGVLEVTGDAFYDESPIWKSQVFPSRISVKVRIALQPEFGVPVLDMRDELTVFEGLSNPNLWSGPFRGSPARWKQSDGEAIVRALQDAQADPVERPLGRHARSGQLSIDAETVETAEGSVSVPLDEQPETNDVQSDSEAQPRTHTEIQYALLKLGSDMGFDVHVARNDISQEWNGRRLADVPRTREALPKQFDPATNRIIELIDVLWLDGGAIVAAFEVESTTSIYSGLLRMSDLVSMQPNISIPLFLVAGEKRREKVIEQVNRPTFARMQPPLHQICRYISFEGLRESLDRARGLVRYLKPDWLQEVSESCELDDIVD